MTVVKMKPRMKSVSGLSVCSSVDNRVLFDQVGQVTNWMSSYKDVVHDVHQSLHLLRYYIQAMSGTPSVEGPKLLELLDIADVDYLLEELPDFLDLFDEHLRNLHLLRDSLSSH